MTVDVRAAARRPLHLALGGALVVATALIPSAESVAADQTSEVTLPYTCQFPSGPEEVEVAVKAVLPVSARTAETIRPGDVSVDVSLARSALAQFTAVEAATLSAVAELTVRNTVGEHTADASWQQLEAPAVTLPPEGEGEDGVVLAATGDVPTVAFGSPGRATIAPAALSLTLASFTEDGAPTTPPELPVGGGPAPPPARPPPPPPPPPGSLSAVRWSGSTRPGSAGRPARGSSRRSPATCAGTWRSG